MLLKNDEEVEVVMLLDDEELGEDCEVDNEELDTGDDEEIDDEDDDEPDNELLSSFSSCCFVMCSVISSWVTSAPLKMYLLGGTNKYVLSKYKKHKLIIRNYNQGF